MNDENDDDEIFAHSAAALIRQFNELLQRQQAQIRQRHDRIKELDLKIASLEDLSKKVDQLRQEQAQLEGEIARQRVKLRFKNQSSSSLSTNENNSNESSSTTTTQTNNILGGAELRHVDSNFELSSVEAVISSSEKENKKFNNTTRLSRVIDDSARHHYSISPELEARTQEVIHKKYGGRDKAERAARVIQESYRQYRLRQSFHKLRQAKRRRLTLDSLASSNAEIEVALKNHKKEVVVLNINNTDSEETLTETTTTTQQQQQQQQLQEKSEKIDKKKLNSVDERVENGTSTTWATVGTIQEGSQQQQQQQQLCQQQNHHMKLIPEPKVAEHRLSAISIADSSCSNVTAGQRASYIESDDEEVDKEKKENEHLYKNIHRNSWIQPDHGQQSENEILRKRMYRIGLNLFNKKPEKGLAFLVKHSFVADQPSVIANFLVTRKGISRQVLGEYLGSGSERTKKILKSLCNEIDLNGLDVDEALRKFQSHIRIQGEAQRVERLIEAFAQRYLEANPEMARQLENPDSIFILAFAIIMLNTDLHSPSMRKEKRMSEEDFIKNLSGINNGKDLDLDMLSNIYNRIKKYEYKANDDHINQVLVIDQRIIGRSKPALAMPHRRLVCYCRMYQIADLNRPQRVGVHQREVFLFNDLLLITKLSGRRRSQYLFRQSYQLLNLEVEPHNNDNYPYAIKILESQVQQIMFSFPNKQDRQNFLQDITESIQEVRHMESLRIEDSLEEMREEKKENQKSPLTATRKLSSSLHNLSLSKENTLKTSESFRGTTSVSLSVALADNDTEKTVEKATTTTPTKSKKTRSASLQLGQSTGDIIMAKSPPTTLSLSSSTSQTGLDRSTSVVSSINTAITDIETDNSIITTPVADITTPTTTTSSTTNSFFGFLSGKSRKNSTSVTSQPSNQQATTTQQQTFSAL